MERKRALEERSRKLECGCWRETARSDSEVNIRSEARNPGASVSSRLLPAAFVAAAPPQGFVTGPSWLRPEYLRVIRRPVEVSDQLLFESVTRDAEVVPQPMHVRVAKRRETARHLDVLLEHLDLGHTRHGRRNRQAHGKAQEGARIGLTGFLANQELLPINLHGDNAQALSVGSYQGGLFKLAVAGGVERHLRAVEGMAFDSLGQYSAVRVAGHPDEAGHF